MTTDNAIKYGFRPVMTRSGAAIPNPIECLVATGYQGSEGAISIDLCVGDPVKRLSTGYIAHADAGDSIYGVVAAVLPYYNGTRMVPGRQLPGGTAWGTVMERASRVLVYPAADLIFEADCDDNTTATTEATYLALIGENCDHSWNTASGSVLGNPRIDISTHVTTTAGWRLVGISKSAENQDFAGNYVKLLCVVNETLEAPFVTTGV